MPVPPPSSDATEDYRAAVSSMERRLTQQGRDRKADLVRHAEQLFSAEGYANTRIIDIARAAGVAKGLFYWYFENKEALFREIVLDIRQQLRAEQARAVAEIDDPLEQIYVGTVVSVVFVCEHHRLYGLIQQVVHQHHLREVNTETSGVHAHDTARILREGQRQGLVREDDAVALALANAGVVNAHVVAHLDQSVPGSIDEIAHATARYVVRAVAVSSDVADASIERAVIALKAR